MRQTRGLAGMIPVALALSLLAGCSTDIAPTASPGDGAPAAKRAWQSRGGKTQAWGSRAGSPAQLHTQTVSGSFSQAAGGRLKVGFRRYGSWGMTWVKDAVFEVAPGAMDAESAEITMAVTSGCSVDDVVVAFRPSGLAFRPPGTLEVTLWWCERRAPSRDQLQVAAEHITAGGTVTDVVVSVQENGTYKAIVTIEVPGFSLYGLRD